MNAHKLKHLSMRLSWMLRHGAREAGLPMDEAGWVSIADLLRCANIPRSTLDLVVEQNNKSRFLVAGDRVRASQGHSTEGTPVTPDALEQSWTVFDGSEPLWHGTSIDAVSGIARTGILPRKRTHVHLAEALDSRIGKRANVHLNLAVSPARLRHHGLVIYRSQNDVILVREVPVACIADLIPVSKRAHKERVRLRQQLGLPAESDDERPRIKVHSCGVLLLRQQPEPSFLLLKRGRLDLPKGHIQPGESERDCALRELQEETGIDPSVVQLDPDFQHEDRYVTRYRRFGGALVEKKLTIFLGFLTEDVPVRVSEHSSHCWLPFDPPHRIQAKTIDPLLAAVAVHTR